MPRSLWQSIIWSMDDKLRFLREVAHKSDKRDVASESDQSRHICRFNTGYTCACPSGVCANDDATYRHARGPYLPVEPNHLGNFRCPVSGKLCSSFVCRDWCEGSGSGATLNNDRRDAAPTYNSGNT